MNTIVGYAGPPEVEIPQEILQKAWEIPNIHEAMAIVCSEMGRRWSSPAGFKHSMIRSAKPGIRNTAPGGYRTEIIVNVPCKMSLIANPDQSDEVTGYTKFKMSGHTLAARRLRHKVDNGAEF